MHYLHTKFPKAGSLKAERTVNPEKDERKLLLACLLASTRYIRRGVKIAVSSN